jgi:hypothetical protein
MFIQSFPFHTIRLPSFAPSLIELCRFSLELQVSGGLLSALQQTHLVPRFGLFETLGDIISGNMGSPGVISVRTGTLESATPSRVLVEVGRVVGLSRMGENSESLTESASYTF